MNTPSPRTKFAVDRLLPVVVGLVFLLIIPTGAVVQSGAVDAIGPQESIVLAPADGPNGAYAEIDDENHELTVNLSSPERNATGVNPDAETTVERIFSISNEGEVSQQIWIAHTGTERALTVYDARSGAPLERDQNVSLAPGETIEVSMQIDTTPASITVRQTLVTKIVLRQRALNDADDDGIPDGEDEAPNDPEDQDGVEDGDGVPEEDADGDGVPDEDDPAPLDPDRDDDGILDGEDGAPDRPEDQDGVEDGDGVPEEDADGDGVPDEDDPAPLDPDRDDDGVPDGEDGEPDRPEDDDGYQDGDGIPDPGPHGGDGDGAGDAGGGGGAGGDTGDDETGSGDTAGDAAAGSDPGDDVRVDPEDPADEELADQVSVTELEVTGPDGDGRDGPVAEITRPTDPEAAVQVGGNGTQVSDLEGSISGEIEGEVRVGPKNPELNQSERRAVRRALNTTGSDAVTIVEQDTPLVGSHSLFASKESVDDRLRMIRHVDISVPEGMENTSATVSLSIPEERFGDTPPEEAVIAHNTADGWQLLETRIESRGDGEVTLAAVTPGFSRFAVFATNRVEYQWRVEGERDVRTGQRIVPRFREVGRYQVNLSVEDAFGLTDDTVYHVLVDDIPRAEVATVEKHGRNRTATLRARVTNQVGSATVVWRFPDGSVRRGRTVTHRFAAGQRTVDVRVVDTYGAASTTEHAVGFGLTSLFPVGIPFEMRVLLGSIGVGLAAVLFRWRLFWLAMALLGRHSPVIARLRGFHPNPGRDGFVVGEVRIEDDEDDLTRVEFAVLDDDGDAVGETVLTLDETPLFEAADERIRARTGHTPSPATGYTLVVRGADADDNVAERRFTWTPEPVNGDPSTQSRGGDGVTSSAPGTADAAADGAAETAESGR